MYYDIPKNPDSILYQKPILITEAPALCSSARASVYLAGICVGMCGSYIYMCCINMCDHLGVPLCQAAAALEYYSAVAALHRA